VKYTVLVLFVVFVFSVRGYVHIYSNVKVVLVCIIRKLQ